MAKRYVVTKDPSYTGIYDVHRLNFLGDWIYEGYYTSLEDAKLKIQQLLGKAPSTPKGRRILYDSTGETCQD
jgi:hypothetical protein